MNTFIKLFLSSLLMVSLHGISYASVIAVVTESTANGNYWDIKNEGGLDPVNFNNPQISEVYGSRELGSAGSFDSISDVEGDSILFKNGNASFGAQAFSSSRTVVDITFRNTGSDSVIPILKSQILPAGMGFFMSDCSAENIRECGSSDEIDFGFGDVTSLGGAGTAAIGAMFDFKVVAGNNVLYSLSASMELIIGDNNNPNTIVENFSQVEGVLNGFRRTSPAGSQQQHTYDWGATNFDVIFPDELLPDETATVSYITEVSTYTSAFCAQIGAPSCAVAFGAFGDPIGRGGSAGSRPDNNVSRQSVNFEMFSDNSINGYEAGLYRMATPTFEDGVLSYRAVSGPGITAVPSPAPLSMLLIGFAYMIFSRKRNLN